MEKVNLAVLGFLIGVVLTSALFIQFSSFPKTTGNVILAPTGNIQNDNITVYADRIVIRVPNATISNYEPTGSMTPLIDSNAHGIRIVPRTEDEINIGDLVSFNMSGRMIVHRVVQKGQDSQGTFFVTRGDNNELNDEMIRFSDIEYKTIGILY